MTEGPGAKDAPPPFTDEQRAVRENHNQGVVARLKPGVELTRRGQALACHQ